MKKVIIIGAGPAGLTAAYELLKQSKDYQVTILEESDKIGGISRTVRHNGNRMDIGGHRFFSKDDTVAAWWDHIMPLQASPSFDDKLLGRDKPLAEAGPDPEADDRVMLIRTRISRIYYLKKFFDYPISMKLQTFKNMGFVRTMKAGFSYLYSSVHKLPETSLENFYINRFGRVLYGMFFESYTEKLWGRHPREISADWGAQRVKGLSILAVIKDMFSKIFKGKNRKVETSLIEQFYYPKFGPGHLWECVADDIIQMGGSIKMNSRVVGIDAADNTVSSVTYSSDDGALTTEQADLFISSMPLKDLFTGLKDKSVTPELLEIANGLPYRDFVTVGLLIKRLHLKNNTDIKTLGDITPDCWMYIQDAGVKLGRIQVFNNWSPYMVADPVHTAWIGLEYFCTEGDGFWTMSDQECIDFAVNELIKMDLIERCDVLDSHRERVRKAYPAYFDTYSRIDELIKFLNKYDNLYCVGRNGQHRYNNMDHSMATSFETVHNIMTGAKDKSNIWNVNTESEYHEKK